MLHFQLFSTISKLFSLMCLGYNQIIAVKPLHKTTKA